MRYGLLTIPVLRPVATCMFFIAVALLGLFSWYRIPVELMPVLSGQQLIVQFQRPGSDPGVVEREILLPLESRTNELPGVVESWGSVQGSSGRLTIEFDPDTNYRVRELELIRIAADLNREQPTGTSINVLSQDTAAFSSMVMMIQVTGSEDTNSLREMVENEIQPRIAAVPGIRQVAVNGGAPREVTVELDLERSAEFGIDSSQVTSALQQSVQRLNYIGSARDGNLRIAVVVDGRPGGVASLQEIRITPDSPVLLRHVADVRMDTAEQQSAFRINGQPSVGLLVRQDEGANLVRLGRDLRARLELMRDEYNPYGLDFVIGFDAAETVEDQLNRLKQLALTGFLIALIVLYLFLRELRAVAVVAVAVPVSLLAAGAMLYLGGYTLNLITLFGLAIGVGMLVDNSIVVYESVQRCLERGTDPALAAAEGIRRTIRAILTASATNAVVFLPVVFLVDDPMISQVLGLIAAAILLPLAASLLVASGLVPLLAQRLAAPAAMARIRRNADRRAEYNGRLPPQQARDLFSGLLKVALRRPAPWLTAVATIIFLTVAITLPWVAVRTMAQPSSEASEVSMEVNLRGGQNLSAAAAIFDRLEAAVLQLEGVTRVESSFQEEQGSITIHLEPLEERPEGVNARTVRLAVTEAVEELDDIQLRPVSNGAGGGQSPGGGVNLFGGGSSVVAISGPDMEELGRLATQIKQRLDSIPEVAWSYVSSANSRRDEMVVRTDPFGLESHRLNPQQVLRSLSSSGREGSQLQVGFSLPDGREIPLTVRYPERETRYRAMAAIEESPVITELGRIPLGELASISRRPAPPLISHHNGRRELTVNYNLSEDTPQSGPERLQLEESIEAAIRDAYRPPGYTIEALGATANTDWFKLVVLPVLLLLFAVLAMSFESLTMPLLVLIAVPLTVLGATWALVIAGMGADMMAMVGVLVLLGLTVNPAILLVDRMQQRVLKSDCSGGSAAMTAVRERVRPVMMTSCTTIAGLWPLALTTGQEFEIWPPFATVVMGGLVTSTLLTLLVIPVGFVALARLDRLLGRLGPWVVMAWAASTTAIMLPLIMSGQIGSFSWQIISTALVGGLLLWLIVRLFSRPVVVRPDTEAMAVEARYLSKIYGQPGPVAAAWNRSREFLRQTRLRSASDTTERAIVFTLLLLASLFLAVNLQTLFWRVVFSYVAAAFFSRSVIELRLYFAYLHHKLKPSSPAPQPWPKFDRVVFTVVPWLTLSLLAAFYMVLPRLRDEPQSLGIAGLVLLAVLTLLFQTGRRTATRLSKGIAKSPSGTGLPDRLRKLWQGLSTRLFGLGLAPVQFSALSSVHFRATAGMIGILGPNGAGKTTLLRLLAGVLEPSAGTVHYGGVEKRLAGEAVSELIGYLPQEFGLPDHLTAREYLDYYALLYRVGSRGERRAQVDRLLGEVGLGERQDERIGGFSGGMRQRVAVARTLLREPPLIIVDEPTVGLDPRERIRFRNLLSRLARGRVVLFSTHVVEDVAVSCDRVVVLSAGAMVYDGRPADLADRAAGRVWELRCSEGEVRSIETGHKVINQVPESGGLVRLRLLAEDQPHADAVRVEPTLEDGYLQLLHHPGAANIDAEGIST